MIILTAGNAKFKTMIKHSRSTAVKLGYQFFVYDLGDLGFGEKLFLPSPVKTTCVHKPGMIRKFLQTTKEFTTYLDGDAFLVDRIDEVTSADYDIGVTVRRQDEYEVSKSFGWLNAGVMFFRPGALPFIDLWEQHATDMQDDQLGFNRIINPDNLYIRPDQVLTIGAARIKTFPADIYNYYHFPEKPGRAKVLHFRSINWNYRRDHIPLSVL